MMLLPYRVVRKEGNPIEHADFRTELVVSTASPEPCALYGRG